MPDKALEAMLGHYRAARDLNRELLAKATNRAQQQELQNIVKAWEERIKRIEAEIERIRAGKATE